jgi:hypothetical protein
MVIGTTPSTMAPGCRALATEAAAVDEAMRSLADYSVIMNGSVWSATHVRRGQSEGCRLALDDYLRAAHTANN